MLVASIGLSQIAPILPIYIVQLGVSDPASVAKLSGLAFGVTFIISAIFSPIWGAAADRYGIKPMIMRASLGMALVIGLMGFAPNVHVLIILRLLQGAITGYGTACTMLIATQTEKAHVGWALGVLTTSQLSGSLIGPLIGGVLADFFNVRMSFFLIGALMFASFIFSVAFIQDEFNRAERVQHKLKDVWAAVPNKNLTVTLFVTFFIVAVALYSVQPVLTIYVDQMLAGGGHVALMSGVIFSAAGLASIISAPRLGRLGDRIGAKRVILAALLFGGMLFIPQAFVRNPWELAGLRFLFGLAAGGLNPSINALLKKLTPEELIGRVFGLNVAAAYLGTFCGAVFGGQVAALCGVRNLFLMTGVLLLLNAVWFYWKFYRKQLSQPEHLNQTS
jgi:MFS family permease